MLVLPRAIVLAALPVLASCSAMHAAQVQFEMERELQGGRVESARDKASAGLGVGRPTAMPDRVGRATARFLLDRGVLAMAMGDFGAASRDLAEADRIVDGDEIARWNFFTAGAKKPKDASWDFFRRGWVQGLNIPWGPKVYERLMTNPLASLAFMANDDPRAACVEARRFASTERYMAPFAPDAAPVRAFGHLVSSLVCDAAGEPDLACRHLESAARVPRYDVLVPRVGLEARLADCRAGEVGAMPPNLWIAIAFGRAPSALGNVETGLVRIVGGAAAAPAHATVDGETIALPEVADLVASARADYSVAVGLTSRNGCPVQRQLGAWSVETWSTLPAHVHLLGMRATRGEHSVTLRVGTRERTQRITIGDAAKLVAMIEPTYGELDPTPPEFEPSLDFTKCRQTVMRDP